MSDDNTAGDQSFGVIVQAEIQPDRMEDFLQAIEHDAIESRNEPGCLRFDVVRSQEEPSNNSVFFFYEMYQNQAAFESHCVQPHFDVWKQFMDSGGTVHFDVQKTHGAFLTTVRRAAGSGTSGSSISASPSSSTEEKPFAVVVQAVIQPDRIDEFLKVIEADAVESRKEQGCLCFDVVRSQDQVNKFFFYELYEREASFDFHCAQSYALAWKEFMDSGGTISLEVHRTNGEFLSN